MEGWGCSEDWADVGGMISGVLRLASAEISKVFGFEKCEEAFWTEQALLSKESMGFGGIEKCLELDLSKEAGWAWTKTIIF